MSVTTDNVNNLLKVLVKNKTKQIGYKWKSCLKHRSNILLCQKKALLVKIVSAKSVEAAIT